MITTGASSRFFRASTQSRHDAETGRRNLGPPVGSRAGILPARRTLQRSRFCRAVRYFSGRSRRTDCAGADRQDACPTLILRAALLVIALLCPLTGSAQTRAAALTNPPIVLTVEGTNVWIQRYQSNRWEDAYPKEILQTRDRGRTGTRSRTTIRLSDLSVMRIGWNSEFEIRPLPESNVDAEFSLFHGLMRLLNRDRPGRHRFVTPTATAATRGTEFVLQVAAGTGRTVLTVFEGEAELNNARGSVLLASGEQGIAEAGRAPFKTAVIETRKIVQWCLYYPGVLDLNELPLAPSERAALSASLEEYRRGNLLRALAVYPEGRAPVSDSERVYRAALLLSVGQVAQSESLLETLSATNSSSRVRRLAESLRRVVDTVNLRLRTPPSPAPSPPRLATEWLARSYAEQSRLQLSEALNSARRCVEQSPEFAFGWVRVAELQFSRGHIADARDALSRGLALAPQNAEALALRGFLFSAQNQTEKAINSFGKAIAIDGGLGNAWLGRGLCRIHRGDADAGRFDLQVAAAVEPQRSLLRSYLGKAFGNADDVRHAERELRIAKALDPNDPTPWLYSALLLRDLNRVNESVRNLERSQELNDNRRVYRSRLLLDQDRAVRGANMANVYRDAGMTDVSVREAGRAVNADYANYSAHRFLADSFNELRDPKQINLRYETAWFTEYLLANLLAPVGAGTLSQTISQQEYSKLFERNRLAVASSTEFLSHGEWIQHAAQSGTYGNSSYAAELFYHSDRGRRPNNDLEQFATVLNLKQQITPQDSVYLRLNDYDGAYGDVNQYYDQADANPGLRTSEHYDPSLLAGYHHEWGPGRHTLLLAGRLEESLSVRNPFQSTLFLDRGLGGPVTAVTPLIYEQNYHDDLELYAVELQQLFQIGNHAVVLGGRSQSGDLDTRNEEYNGVLSTGPAVDVPITNHVRSSFTRWSLYAYDDWQIAPWILLAGGATYDWLSYPADYRYAPIASATKRVNRFSPKAGLIWTPADNTTIRAAWFRALGGVSLDQSVRLEPSQVAGFVQAYRSLIPESVAGANAAPTFETWAASFEQKFGKGTFVAISGDLASSTVNRTVGVVEFSAPAGAVPAGTPERLQFRERTLTVALNQLLGNDWSIGANYRISQANLDDYFTDVPAGAVQAGGFQARRELDGTLQQANLFALFRHPSGFFARAHTVWTAQSNQGYSPERPGDNFWQFNLETGYRFARRRAEVRLGLLNVTDQNYRLNPLNLTAELPRSRTLAVRVQFNF